MLPEKCWDNALPESGTHYINFKVYQKAKNQRTALLKFHKQTSKSRDNWHFVDNAQNITVPLSA